MSTTNRDGPGWGRARRIGWVVFPVVAAAALLSIYVVFTRHSAEPAAAGVPRDPRLDYAGPFRNVDPAVQYVSDTRCAECHADKARSFARHPMGRSLQPIGKAAQPNDVHSSKPFAALGSLFAVVRQGDRMLHRRTQPGPDGRPAATLEWQVDYVLGSGTRGYSYLTNHDGFLFQTPISWFAQKKQGWDLSPGFGPPILTGRPVLPDCLYCHANQAHFIPGSLNHYRQPVFDGHAIGCQRCHGPGERHVRARSAERGTENGGVDHTIVDPGRLKRPLLQAVCEHCHLTGAARVVRHGRDLYDFRPGMPLEAFLSVFVKASRPGDQHKAVSHVEQMYQSICFQASTGKEKELSCISCHDPHVTVPKDRRPGYYRKRCLNCHAGDAEGRARNAKHQGLRARSCSSPVALRQAKQDNCTACHMPRYDSADIAHTASTDHRILRHGKQRAQRNTAPDAADGLPIISFYGGRKAGEDDEDARDRAVALVQLALNNESAALQTLGKALPALESAVRRDPDDWAAGEAHGYALGLLGRSSEALAALEAVLARASKREPALVGAASMAEALGKTQAAVDYWRRAVTANPWAPEYGRRLVLLLVKQEAWDEAQTRCQAWIRLDPFSAEARTQRVVCLLAAGKKDEARAEFARLVALAPANLAELQIRFEKKLR